MGTAMGAAGRADPGLDVRVGPGPAGEPSLGAAMRRWAGIRRPAAPNPSTPPARLVVPSPEPGTAMTTGTATVMGMATGISRAPAAGSGACATP
ncbi:hypothetical protein [Jiangella anatolica]|uniref:hypothetical protein n=1 Tax=Jiangella anatolica TaxID=2670374 RepID=UPI0018F56C81|nr:hypothetical protein [Jiangella anatolica]